MTVSTVVAGLLPIMWSTRVGAEVMKPLATPVLGGMLSSLAHVLIVTPVIFFWIRERQYGLQAEAPETKRRSRLSRRTVVLLGAAVLAVAAAVFVWKRIAGPGGADQPAGGAVIQSVQSADLTIALMSPTGALRQGRNTFFVEFRRENTLVHVGRVGASANMPMPGMVMSSGLQIEPSGVTGRYVATAEFGMAGAWQFSIQWDGPAGRGSVSFEGSVQ